MKICHKHILGFAIIIIVFSIGSLLSLTVTQAMFKDRGNITIESQEGKGTTFFFILPKVG